MVDSENSSLDSSRRSGCAAFQLMLASRYYRAPHLYELAFSLPPQSVWRARAFEAILSELEQLGSHDGDLLDVGCGAGVLAKMIALRSPDICIKAIDSSPYMVRYARKFHAHASVDYAVRSFWDENGTYDAVTAAYCWHFFPLDDAALKLKSILRVEGRAFIVATRETPITRIHRCLFGVLSPQTLSLYRPKQLSESLQKQGFSVEWRMVDRIEGSYLVVARLR